MQIYQLFYCVLSDSQLIIIILAMPHYHTSHRPITSDFITRNYGYTANSVLACKFRSNQHSSRVRLRPYSFK